MFRHAYHSSALTLLAVVMSLLAPQTGAQVVTSEGWAEQAAGLEFYIEVPMIDNKDLENYGVGGNITAESIINACRYADASPLIHHVVFMMDTGGGLLFHAEAMEDAIERHHTNTEFHIVVQNAISAGIWTAFSCDNIFMCRAGTIGGATAYYTIGNTAIVAGDIPSIATRLELTAVRNGYPEEIIRPLMQMDSELYYWVDDAGKKVLANEEPKNKGDLKNYRQLDRKDTVLTLTTNDAIDIGIAKPIEEFDAALVGDKIGAPNWMRGNRFGEVLDRIGWIYNTTKVLEDEWVARKLSLRRFPVTSYNRDNRFIKEMLDERRKHSAVIDALRKINTALNELPNVHPEKHVYLAGPDKKTIVQDPAQWEADVAAARIHARNMVGGLSELMKAYKDLEIDQGNLDLIANPIRSISIRVNRIGSFGNAAYWEAEEE